MADAPIQNYANHAHRPTATGVAGLFGLAAFLVLVVHAFRTPSAEAVGLLLLNLSVLTLVLMSRTYTVRLQNRIIRQEMQSRCARLGIPLDFGGLTMPQITALRFASDVELPGLMGRAIAENLTSDQIKRAVVDWQPDWLRT